MAQRIQKVEIKNFKCIDYQNVDLNGNNVYLVGPNAKGKTSFIDACYGQLPGKPLKDGERKGEINIEIDGYIIEFNFSEKNQKAKLNIFDKEGKPQKAPATLFKQLFGINDFNIDEFLKLSDSKQVDFIKNIIGIDWTDVDAKRKELYDERTFKDRKIKELDARLTGKMFKKDLVKVEITPLMEKLSKANELNTRIDNGNDFVTKSEEIIESKKIQIKLLQEEINEISSKVNKSKEWLSENKKVSTQDIEEEIKAATENNEEIALQSQFNREREEVKKLVSEVDSIEEEMKSIDEEKKKHLEAASMPVRGLTFDEDKLYLDGIPFESDQVNTARRIIAGIEIQYALCGEVKIARFDGSLLDKNSMEEVEKWAKDKGVQLFVEIVDREGEELKIEVEEVNND